MLEKLKEIFNVDYNPDTVYPENQFQFEAASFFRVFEYLLKVILSLFGLEDM